MKRNIWLDGVMGVIVGDALGCPVQFLSRDELRKRGLVRGMEGHGTYDMPEGTWTDDSSMTLGLLESIRTQGKIDLNDIMTRFVAWVRNGEFTPFGQAFDIGNTCYLGIRQYSVAAILLLKQEVAEILVREVFFVDFNAIRAFNLFPNFITLIVQASAGK